MGSVFKNPTIPRRYIPKVVKHEEGIQRRVCSYIRNNYPHVFFYSDYAAGLRLTMNQARVRKSLQSGSASPDIFLAAPAIHTQPDGTVRQYHGLFIELKKEGTTIYVTQGKRKGKIVSNPHIMAQAAVLDSLNKAGYLALFGVGYDATIKIIDKYMGKPQTAELF